MTSDKSCRFETIYTVDKLIKVEFLSVQWYRIISGFAECYELLAFDGLEIKTLVEQVNPFFSYKNYLKGQLNDLIYIRRNRSLKHSSFVSLHSSRWRNGYWYICVSAVGRSSAVHRQNDGIGPNTPLLLFFNDDVFLDQVLNETSFTIFNTVNLVPRCPIRFFCCNAFRGFWPTAPIFVLA